MFEDNNLTDELVAEIRKHPGIVAGAVAVLAGVGFATLFLRQRTGPRRIEVIRDRLDPRYWAEELALGERLTHLGRRARSARDEASDFADDAKHRAFDLGSDFSDRARDFGGRAKDRAYDLGLDLGDRARDFGGRAKDRALDFADDARDRFDSWRNHRRRRHARKYAVNKVRSAAGSARDFASDHAREGAALLTVGLIAAAIGAIALENRKHKGE